MSKNCAFCVSKKSRKKLRQISIKKIMKRKTFYIASFDVLYHCGACFIQEGSSNVSVGRSCWWRVSSVFLIFSPPSSPSLPPSSHFLSNPYFIRLRFALRSLLFGKIFSGWIQPENRNRWWIAIFRLKVFLMDDVSKWDSKKIQRVFDNLFRYISHLMTFLWSILF